MYKLGFTDRNQTGSHPTLKDNKGHRVTTPIHSGKNIPKGTLMSIIKSTGLTKDQFLKLL